jgi:PAS domain S-box-containing protein
MNPIVTNPLQKKHDPYSEKFEYLEELIQGQSAILEMISGGADLKDILNAIVLWAEKESTEGLLASILLTNYNGENLLHGAAPSLPEDYNNAIHGVAIANNVGSCGTAAYTKQLVVVEDIETDPRWSDFKVLAGRYGLKACWSSPLINKSGDVLGTFAMYYRHSKKPSAHDLRIIKLITNTTIIAIELIRAREERLILLENEQRVHQKTKDESRQFYRLFMNIPAMVAVLRGPNHVFELANPIYMKAIGSNRDVIGKPVHEALPEVIEQGFIKILDDVYQTSKPFYGNEVPIQLDKSGDATLETAYFNFIYHPIKNEEGATEGIFAHAVDVTELVTERKRAEENEQRFKSFVLNSPMPIGIYVGKEMRIQTANDAILKAWEKNSSVIGKTFREALPELEGQPFYDILDNVYSTGNTYEAIEERVDLLRDGKITPTYWNFSYTPLRNEFGNIYGVMNTAAEVTELVTAKKQLLATEETLKSAITISELGTWQIDLQNARATFSKRVADWFGLPEQGATLEDVIDRIDEQHRETVAKAITHAINSKGIYEAEYRVKNPLTSVEAFLHAKGKVVIDENGNLQFNGICKDITFQKQTEKELEKQVELRTVQLQHANDELNILNDNLKQFVYVASHDLQEPLRKINLFADILRNKTEESLDHESKRYIRKISQAAGRMTNLIKDLLDFSRVEADNRTFSSINLEEVVSNVVEDYEMLIQQKSASIEVSSLPVIEGIPLQMNQLFYNLIGNALKFTKENVAPQVTISSRILTQENVLSHEKLNPNSTYSEIIIKDNGIGFNPKFAEQIFEIFQRLHGKDDYEGTGIGLALCKKIAENHKGLIFSKSNENEGAAFHLVLPVENKANVL